MSGRATLILFLLLLSLCAGYWLTGYLEDSAEQEAEVAKRIFAFDESEIDMLSVERTGEPPVEALREGEEPWQIIAPYRHIPANQVVWSRVAHAIANLTNERTIDDENPEFGIYGLERPLVEVIAGTTGGELVQVHVGNADPTGDFRYAQVGNGPVVLIRASDFPELDRPLKDLRERHLVVSAGEDGIHRLDFARLWVSSLQATDPPPSEASDESQDATAARDVGAESVVISFQRNALGAWRMTQPIQSGANQESVGALVREVQFAVGRNHIDDPESLNDYGLDPGFARLTVYGSGASPPEIIYLGWAADAQQGGGIFVKKEGNPSVFVIDVHILTLLPHSPDAFRSARFFSSSAKNLESIRIIGPPGGLTLTNDLERGWTLSQPAFEDTSHQAVSAFVSFLKQVEGVTFPDEAEALGLDEPQVTIDFTFREGEPPVSVSVGDQVPGSDPPTFYARQDDGSITTLRFDLVRKLGVIPFDFRKKDIFSFELSHARRLSLSFDGQDYEFEKGVRDWKLTKPAGKILESQADMDTLLGALAGVRALAEADAESAEGTAALSEPILTAVVSIAPPGRGSQQRPMGPLRIGATGESGSRQRFSTSDGVAGAFMVDQAIIDEVREALRGVRDSN